MNPDFSGTWVADLQRSKLLGPIPIEMRVTIEHQGAKLVQTVRIIRPGGIEEHATFTYLTTGEEVTNIVRGAVVRSRATWQDNELLIESWMKTAQRDFHFRDFWSLSAKDSTLTMEHRDDDLSGQITVLEKISH